MLSEFFVSVAQSFEAPLPKIFDEHVADGHEVLEDPPASGLSQFQRDAVFRHVQAVEPPIPVPRLFAGFSIGVGGDALGRGHRAAVGIVDAQGLHLDNLGAHVGEQLGAVGPSPDAG